MQSADWDQFARIREEIGKQVPSVTDIAMIAAILSVGPQGNQHPARILPETAFELWTSCQSILQTKFVKSADENQRSESTPTPKKYPVKLDEFLRLALPHKRVPDRMKMFRESVRLSMKMSKQYQASGNVIDFKHVPEPTDDEISEAIIKIRERGFDQARFRNSLITFRQFAEHIGKENRRNRAKAGAEALKASRKDMKKFAQFSE